MGLELSACRRDGSNPTQLSATLPIGSVLPHETPRMGVSPGTPHAGARERFQPMTTVTDCWSSWSTSCAASTALEAQR
ncbi:hypothetical protein SAMN04515671_1369 [Nakamurella panacisegetis]|uniref:Uncharacterized protein n=1 Tax=Nakamurella panacisegetis TaxID=1090615 RepID=A0A1H0KMR9_9ACTN|nr:hypothetical protein SAMN04515671_1369 [Nakamurella panacisegetis]